MGKYILTLDIGTTNIKAFLFNKEGEIFAEAKRRPAYILDETGKVEQDPAEIWEFSRQVMDEIVTDNNINAENIEAIGISTQRASFLFWDKRTGKTYSNIIGWQDVRSASYAEEITNSFSMRMVRFIAKIGFFFTRKTKMLTGSMLKFNTDHASVRTGFYLKNNPEINKEMQDPSSNIIWGTIDSWILWNLTGGEVHATDYSNISSTGLLDPFTLKWNSIVLKAFKIPKHILPEIKETGDDFGSTTLFGGGIIKITAVQADQQASLFGQCCFSFGEMKITNGTGSFIDINTGNEPKASKRKLYPLIAWRLNGETTYLLEGVSHNTGNIIDWIQKELSLYQDPSETESMALSVNSTNGVYFLPTFSSGISYPYWDHTAKGNIFGISLNTKKEHIVRAVLEGISYRIKDIVEGIIADINIPVEKIKVDGGVSNNKFFLQFLCDILGIEVEHSLNPETTALGVTFMAGLVTGFWNSKEELISIRKIENIYKPQINEQERKIKASYWNDIIKRSLNYQNY